ncbi:MAG: hypothetical protein EP330_07915 [Deltaproteobacteria bacterium]|nr:MAG: hypothetical protein EP330_07915 [Deltaproteobacteria bacterium]
MLWWTALALASPVADLAPTAGEVRLAVERLEGRLIDAEALGEAVGRVHNRWVELSGKPGTRVACDSPAAELAGRSALFGGPWRDAVQLARVELSTVERAAAAPSAAPLLDERDRERIAALTAQVGAQERAVLEASSWHATHLGSLVARCKPVLAAAPGIARTEVLASGETPGPVAVALLAGARVCADEREVRGPTVLVVDSGAACYGACGCGAEPLDPAAVLGEE